MNQTKLPFSRWQSTCEHDIQTGFLLLWPWPHDLDTWVRPRYPEPAST